MKLSVLTLNIYGTPTQLTFRKRQKLFIEEIKRISPDVICLQEVVFARTAKRFEKLLSKYGYKVVYNKGKIINRTGLLIASKHEILESSFNYYKTKGLKRIFPAIERAVKKGILTCKLTINGEIVNIVNTHLQNIWKGNELEYKENSTQLSELSKHIELLNGPVVCCGDFNQPPNSVCIKEFISKSKVKDSLSNSDSVTVTNNNTNRKSIFHKKFYNVHARYDYCFHKNINIITSEIALHEPISGMHISDHFGIYSELDVL